MEEYNFSPYHDQTESLSNIPVTPLMIEHLRGTKPWVRFMSVMLFIGAGLMVLAGLFMFLIPMATPGMGGFGAIVGVVYILFAALYIAPAYFLHQFASSIGDLMKGGGDVALESALGSQKSYWRFVGISVVVVISLYVLFIVGAILFGVMNTASRMR
ncbi:MAG: hypothetical protein ACRD43_04135 [Pyrinomonadaceae bacterium]